MADDLKAERERRRAELERRKAELAAKKAARERGCVSPPFIGVFLFLFLFFFVFVFDLFIVSFIGFALLT
jgi:hypothetical protein